MLGKTTLKVGRQFHCSRGSDQ